MNSLYKQFGTNKGIEKTGVDVEYADGPDDKSPATFTIARAGGANVAFSEAFSAHLKPLRRRIANDAVSDTEIEKKQREAFVDHVLKGWKNVKDKDDQPLEFNRANALKLFEDLPDLYDDLLKQAQQITIFKNDARDAVAKN